jgi:hypothetical protein
MAEWTTNRVFGVGLANGLAALGGGAILGRAMGVLREEPWLGGDSLLALVGGTALSLAVIVGLRKSGRPISPAWFAAGTGLMSLILTIILGFGGEGVPAANGASPVLLGLAAWLFFVVLVARWTLSFVGRAFRADVVSAAQKLPAVELPYFTGLIIGLVIWRGMGWLGFVLLIDTALQGLAALLDAITARSPSGTADGSPQVQATPGPFPTARYARATVTVVAMTAGIQVVLLSLAHQLGELPVPGMKTLASDILVAIYVGAAAAAVACVYLKIRYNEPRTRLASWTGGSLVAERIGCLPIPLLSVTAAATVGTVGAIYGAMAPEVSRPWVLALVAVAVAFLGLITLPVCGRVGQLAMAADRPGMVAMTYGIMGVAGTVTLFGLVHSTPLLGLGGPVTTSVGCLALAHGAMGWAWRP